MPKKSKGAAPKQAAGPVESQQPTQDDASAWPDASIFTMANDPGVDSIVNSMMENAVEAMPIEEAPDTNQAPTAPEPTARAEGGDEEEEEVGDTSESQTQQPVKVTTDIQPPEVQGKEDEESEEGEDEGPEQFAGLPEDFDDLFPELAASAEDAQPVSNSAQRRIDTLTGRLREQERRNQELEARLAKQEQQPEVEEEQEEVGANLGFVSDEAKRYSKDEAKAKDNINNARKLLRKLKRGEVEEVAAIFRDNKIQVDDYEPDTLRYAIEDYLIEYQDQYQEAKIQRLTSEREFKSQQKAQQEQFRQDALELYPWMSNARDPRFKIASQIMKQRKYLKRDPAWPVMLGSYTETYIKLKRLNTNGGEAAADAAAQTNGKANGKKTLKPLRKRGIRPLTKPGGAGSGKSATEGDRFAAASARVMQEPTQDNLLDYVGAMIGEDTSIAI